MTDAFRSEGFRDVSTYLVLRTGTGQPIRFLKEAFAAAETMGIRDPNGRLAHARMRVGDSVVQPGESPGKWTSRSPMHYLSLTWILFTRRQSRQERRR